MAPVERLRNLPPPPPPMELPPLTDEMRARAIARTDEMLAHINDPLPEGEPDWDVEALFPPNRVR